MLSKLLLVPLLLNSKTLTKVLFGENKDDFQCLNNVVYHRDEEWKNYKSEVIATDLSGHVFDISHLGEIGYEIVEKESGVVIERSFEGKPPFDYFAENIYYFGPTYYYRKEGDTFYPLNKYVGKKISLEEAEILQEEFDIKLSRILNKEKSDKFATSKQNRSGNHYIPSSHRIRYDPFPENRWGCCGFVAASIVLHYWDWKFNGYVVADAFKDDEWNLNDTTEYNPSINLKDNLIWRNGGNVSSWGATVRNAMVSYCDDYNLNHSIWWGFFNYTPITNVDSELLMGRPVILFGLFEDYPDSNLINHAVTAYGTTENGYYIVNYGWKNVTGANHVEIPGGVIGSITTFALLSWPGC